MPTTAESTSATTAPKKAVKKKTAKKKIEDKGTIPFYIGSDPEYLLFYGQRGLDASHILRNFFGNDTEKYGHVSEGYFIKGGEKNGNFGWDGSSSTGELRPKATKNIYEHVDFLGNMLQAIHDKMPFVDITTLSIGSPIGGHIHVDSHIPYGEDNMTSDAMKKRKRADKILMTFLLPLIASDHRISSLARLQGEYGKLSDIRYEQKENCVTAEIRGLTAEWLTTPKIAVSTLAYITCVWNEIRKKTDELYQHPNLIRTNQHADSVHRLLLSDYNLITQALVKDLKKTIKDFELYPQFKEEIDYILNPLRVYKDKEKVGWTINRGWNFNKNQPKLTKKTLLDNRIIQEILNKEDVPNIERSFAVNYNDDYNVAMFAKAISDRVATMGWQLKNRYALFGFRKGIEGLTAIDQNGKFYSLSTNGTRTQILQTAKNMFDRLGRDNSYGGTRINPKTGKTVGRDSETIVIGLPYDIRAVDNVAPMIELIWRIENGKLTAKDHAEFTIVEPEVGKTNQGRDLGECVEQYRVEPGSTHNSNNDAIERIINDNENNY